MTDLDVAASAFPPRFFVSLFSAEIPAIRARLDWNVSLWAPFKFRHFEDAVKYLFTQALFSGLRNLCQQFLRVCFIDYHCNGLVLPSLWTEFQLKWNKFWLMNVPQQSLEARVWITIPANTNELLVCQKAELSYLRIAQQKRTCFLLELDLDTSVSRWQNFIPSFPWIAPGWRGGGTIQGKDQILQCRVAGP